MNEDGSEGKGLGRVALTRRSFLKWSALAGTALAGGGFLTGSARAMEQAVAAEAGLPFNADKVVPVRCGSGDVCGMYHIANAYVKDGTVVYYDGCKEAFNKGALCARGASGMQIINSPDRLKYPMVPVGGRGSGQWKRISWDEAYDLLAGKISDAIKNYGPHTVGLPSGHVMTMTTDQIRGRFTKLFSFASGGGPGVCWDNLQFGAVPTLGDYNHLKEDDFHYSKLIVIWGHNPALATPTEWRDGMMKAKQEFGAKIIVIDPRFSETAEKADLYLPVRPGTDAALALGMANVIITEDLYDHQFVAEWTEGFEDYKQLALQYTPEKVEEITWVPADRIRQAARWYATIKPAVLEFGRGGNYVSGDAGWLCVRGATCLIGLTGQIGMRGAGYSVEASTGSPTNTNFWGAWPYRSLSGDVKPIVAPKESVKYPSGAHESQQVLYYGKPYSYQVLLDIGSHIVGKYPDENTVEQALSRIPFIAVEDRFISYTASKFADLVLPNALWTEQAMLVDEYSHMICTGPAVKPMFECKPTYLMLSELSDHICEKLGIEQPAETYMPWRTDEDIVNAMLQNKELPMGGYPDLNYQYLTQHPEGVRGARPYNQDGYVFFREDGDPNKPLKFYTPSGKIELRSQQLEDNWKLPALPVFKEPLESPVSTPDLYKEYPLIGHARVHRHWGFLQYNLISDGGYASPLIREAHLTAKEPTVELNPATASDLGLAEGDMVMVESKYGKLQGRLHLSDRVHPKMVVTPYHWDNIQNRLTPPELSLFSGITFDMHGPYGEGKKMRPQGGMSTYAGFLCKVSKA